MDEEWKEEVDGKKSKEEDERKKKAGSRTY